MRKIRIVVAILLALLFLFANIYAINQLMRFGLALYFYNEMLVAYQVGEDTGLRKELDRVLSQDKMPREKALARDFQAKLSTLKDPERFLKEKTEELNRKINLYRNLRYLAFGLILVVLLFRLIINFLAKANK